MDLYLKCVRNEGGTKSAHTGNTVVAISYPSCWSSPKNWIFKWKLRYISRIQDYYIYSIYWGICAEDQQIKFEFKNRYFGSDLKEISIKQFKWKGT